MLLVVEGNPHISDFANGICIDDANRRPGRILENRFAIGATVSNHRVPRCAPVMQSVCSDFIDCWLSSCLQEGRGLVIAANKRDLVKQSTGMAFGDYEEVRLATNGVSIHCFDVVPA